jgi:hypothetical protein
MKTVATLILVVSWMMLTVMANMLFGPVAAVVACFLPAFAAIALTSNGFRK